MKTYFVILVVLIGSLVAITTMTSCSKEGKQSNNGLAGTKWICITDDDDWVCTINFVDESFFAWTESEGGNTRPYSGKYSYSAPRIIITINRDWIMTGTITGNNMLLNDADVEYTYTFKKQ